MGKKWFRSQVLSLVKEAFTGRFSCIISKLADGLMVVGVADVLLAFDVDSFSTTERTLQTLWRCWWMVISLPTQLRFISQLESLRPRPAESSRGFKLLPSSLQGFLNLSWHQIHWGTCSACLPGSVIRGLGWVLGMFFLNKPLLQIVSWVSFGMHWWIVASSSGPFLCPCSGVFQEQRTFQR